MQILEGGTSIVHTNALQVHVISNSTEFIMQVTVKGITQMIDIALVGQAIRDFLTQPVELHRHMLFDLRAAEMFSLTQLQAFVSELQELRPLINSRLSSSAVCVSTELAENPLIKQFRTRFYQPVRPNLIASDDSPETIMHFFRSNR